MSITDKLAAKAALIEAQSDALDAAKSFIKDHVDDVDITDEMSAAYGNYVAALARLDEVKGRIEG